MHNLLIYFLTLIIGSTVFAANDITKRDFTDSLLTIKSGENKIPDDILEDVEGKKGRKIKYSMIGDNRVYRKFNRKKNVFMVHPFSKTKPAIVDFSKITSKSKGKLIIEVVNEKRGEHWVKLLKDKKQLKYEEIHRGKWEKYRIPFDHNSIVMEVHADEWKYEHSFITYRIEK